jgi:hypothetical protein
VGNAYKTRNMLDQQCSPITACITGIDIGTIGGAAEISQVTNSCTINDTNTTNTQTSPNSGNLPSSTPSSSSKKDDKEEDEEQEEVSQLPLIIGASVGGFIFLLIIIVFLLK